MLAAPAWLVRVGPRGAGWPGWLVRVGSSGARWSGWLVRVGANAAGRSGWLVLVGSMAAGAFMGPGWVGADAATSISGVRGAGSAEESCVGGLAGTSSEASGIAAARTISEWGCWWSFTDGRGADVVVIDARSFESEEPPVTLRPWSKCCAVDKTRQLLELTRRCSKHARAKLFRSCSGLFCQGVAAGNHGG